LGSVELAREKKKGEEGGEGKRAAVGGEGWGECAEGVMGRQDFRARGDRWEEGGLLFKNIKTKTKTRKCGHC